jgi:hypothetical protein
MPNGGLDVFTVIPAGDLLFEEGECRFTLEASEPGKAGKTVNVTVATAPNLTGAAIFRRNSAGGLTRITAENAEAHANSLYAAHKTGGFPSGGWGIDFAHVQDLSTALKWLDNYALSGAPQALAEYLVRVEADEAMPKTLLTCRLNNSTALAEYVRIRIRGYGGERRITHDRSNMASGGVTKEGSGMSAYYTFLSIGPPTDSYYVPNYLEVRLEKNITIDAEGGTNPYFPSTGGSISSMIQLAQGNTLVMEAGSKLTNYTYPVPGELAWDQSHHYNNTAVVLSGGVFELRGGEISNIQGYPNFVFCYDNSGGTPAGTFIYYSGVLTGNTVNGCFTGKTTGDKVAIGSTHNPTLYEVTDDLFKP